MAIDPSIPLQGRPLQLPDPTEQFGRALQLKSMLRQEKQQERAMAEEEKLRQAYMESGGDLKKLKTRAAELGVGPNTMMAIEQGLLKQRESLANIEDKEATVQKGRLQAIGSAAQAVLQLPAEARPEGYARTRANLIQQGMIKPEDAPEQYPGDEAMQLHANSARTSQQIIDGIIQERNVKAREQQAGTAAEREKREGEKWATEKPGLEADAAAKQRQNDSAMLAAAMKGGKDKFKAALESLPYGRAKVFEGLETADDVLKAGMTPEQQSSAAGQAATRVETARHNQVTEKQGAQRVAIDRENANRQKQQFDATYGALVGPDGKALDSEAAKRVAEQDPMARAIANYQLPPPTATRGGPAAATLRKVMAINPNYSAQNWQAQSAMMKGFTSGQQSKEISGINTALGHVGELGAAIDALHNDDTQALNRLANVLGVQTGKDAVTTFKAIVHKVAPEINRAYVGGVGSQGEILAQESDFDPNMGPQQLRSNVRITVKLLDSKIGSLRNQWNKTMGSGFDERFMMPEAEEVVNKWTPGQAGGVSKGPGDAPKPATHRFNPKTGKIEAIQ